MNPICNHGVNRAQTRCRLCEPDLWQINEKGEAQRIEDLGPKLDRIIELLDELVEQGQ